MTGREMRLPNAFNLEEPQDRRRPIMNMRYLCHSKWNWQLRSQQFNIRQEETEEPNLYMQGDWVWQQTYEKKKGEIPKLAPKYGGRYCGSFTINHTYWVCKENKESILHEGQWCCKAPTVPNGVGVRPDTHPNALGKRWDSYSYRVYTYPSKHCSCW